MIKRWVFMLSACATILLAGCDTIDSMKSNAEDVASKLSTQGGVTLGDSSSIANASDPQETPTEKVLTGVNGSAFGIYTDVTDVAMSTAPNKVSLKFTVGDSFSIEESLTFSQIEEKSDGTQEVITRQIITCEETIRIGSLADFQKVFDYLNRAAFESISFVNKNNVYIAALENPYLLADAPLTSFIDCKAYCEEIHTRMREAIDNSKRIVDGSTGIIYHNIGGNEFNLTKYRYQIRRGESVQIEIQDLPEGFTTEDVTFRSDKIGYAMVSGNGTITGGNNGSATITVSLKGAAVYRTVYVQVY